MREMTTKQREILKFIEDNHSDTGVFPSVREIAAHMKFKSTNTVDYYLRQLQEAGHLSRGTRQARTFAIPSSPTSRRRAAQAAQAARPQGIPILGRVAAGEPILAEQNFDGMLEFGTMFRTGEDTFALRVAGDSMINAGIHDGDLVIVKYEGRVNRGEIGVAIVNDEATVKRIYDDGKVWRLEPENDAMKPIIVPKSDAAFTVAGKVVGVIRQL